MAYESIEVDRSGRVGVIRLNRPEKMNAWTSGMQQEQRAAIGEFNADPRIGAIVMTGNGRAFCAGADIGGWAAALSGDAAGNRTDPAPDWGAEGNWLDFCIGSKPLIAAINGYCIGVGLTQILPFDIRIASEAAVISCRFVKMGLLPELGSTALLPRIVGIGAALELSLTARMIDAATALRVGLVSEVVPADALVDRALALGEEIAQNPVPQMIQTKQLFHQNVIAHDWTKVMDAEGLALSAARETPQYREAVTAFMEKREPRFYAD